MAFTGGDTLEITWNHPVEGSGILSPKSAEDFTFDPGGFRGDDDMNGLAGNGEAIRKINQRRWSAEGTIAWDMAVAQELEAMRRLAASPIEADWTITNINGTIYSGKGSPVGDLQGNANTATFSLKISGSGILKKQA